jgi:hypothetical protein
MSARSILLWTVVAAASLVSCGSLSRVASETEARNHAGSAAMDRIDVRDNNGLQCEDVWVSVRGDPDRSDLVEFHRGVSKRALSVQVRNNSLLCVSTNATRPWCGCACALPVPLVLWPALSIDAVVSGGISEAGTMMALRATRIDGPRAIGSATFGRPDWRPRVLDRDSNGQVFEPGPELAHPGCIVNGPGTYSIQVPEAGEYAVVFVIGGVEGWSTDDGIRVEEFRGSVVGAASCVTVGFRRNKAVLCLELPGAGAIQSAVERWRTDPTLRFAP